MKLSIVISIYNSHGVMERQVKHFKRMALPDTIEFVFADDNSNPPLVDQDYDLKNLTFHPTGNKLAWVQGLGRNLASSKAIGDYLLLTDIDHIVTVGMIDEALEFTGAFMRYPRRLGILDEAGILRSDRKSLEAYGAHPRYLKTDDPETGIHNNTYLIKREVFNDIGGYKDEWCNYGYHPVTGIGDDVLFDSAWRKYAKKNGLTQEMSNSHVYVFPNGRFHKDRDLNPWGLFHNLSHKQERFYKDE